MPGRTSSISRATCGGKCRGVQRMQLPRPAQAQPCIHDDSNHRGHRIGWLCTQSSTQMTCSVLQVPRAGDGLASCPTLSTCSSASRLNCWLFTTWRMGSASLHVQTGAGDGRIWVCH